MSVRQLKTFLSVARHGTFAAAAKDIGITQAAVSMQMKGLEEELKTRLFDRVGRSVVLNTAGRGLVPTATQIITLYENMAMSSSTKELGGSLTIGAMPATLERLLPDALSELKRRYPRIEVQVVSGVSSELTLKVERGELDGAVVSEPSSPLSRSLMLHHITREPLVLISGKALKATRVRDVLATEPLIAVTRQSWMGRTLDNLLRQHGIKSRDSMELGHLQIIVQMVRRGFGVSIIPFFEGTWQSDPHIRIWRIVKPALARDVNLVERRAHARSPLTTAFLNCIMAGQKKAQPRRRIPTMAL